jgi:hypothetical protein
VRSLRQAFKYLKRRCLTEADRYNYLTRSGSERSLEQIERHLSGCETCQEDVSILQELLHSDYHETVDQPSARQIEAALDLISRSIQRDKEEKRRRRLWI